MHDIAHIASSIFSQPYALAFFSSYFELWVRWLRSLTPVTYWCMLPGICLLAAFPQLKLFRKIFLCLFPNQHKSPAIPLNLVICSCSYFLNRGVRFLRFLILSR